MVVVSEPATAQQRSRIPRLGEVVDVERLSAGMIRIVLGGPGLAGFDAGEFTDHYVKLQMPPPGAPYGAPFDVEEIRARLPSDQWPRTRSFTVAHWDAERQRLTIEFVIHGDGGVAGPWAAGARPGDQLQLQGPGGAYAPDTHADWHLMAGDASVLPAISASLARVPAGIPVYVVIELAGPEERRELRTPGELHLTWVDQAAGDQGDEGALCRAVSELAFPAGRVQCFVHGEASAVRAIHRHLLVDRHVGREALSISGYWKRNRTDETWRAEKPEWKRLVEQDLETAGDRAGRV
jgi:NADPH-dependent ferric siderophore reductase